MSVTSIVSVHGMQDLQNTYHQLEYINAWHKLKGGEYSI
jgi:hypothetical protein